MEIASKNNIVCGYNPIGKHLDENGINNLIKRWGTNDDIWCKSSH